MKVLTADLYVRAMPVDPLNVMLPAAWKTDGILPETGCQECLINAIIWFDRS